MAKVKAPFLSIAASGSIGGILTAATWKGIKTMRQKSDPSNPNTPAQQAQRNRIFLIVLFWKIHFWESISKPAWNLSASAHRLKLSGYNIFTQIANKFLIANPDSAVVNMLEPEPDCDNKVNVLAGFSRLKDGVATSAAVNSSYVVHGAKPTSLSNPVVMDKDGHAYELSAVIQAPESMQSGDDYYFQIFAEQGGCTERVTGIVKTHIM